MGQILDAEIILIDIPIGLRDSGSPERTCDLKARKYISKRHSSVFPVPCRAAISATTYTEASDINLRETGRKLTKQTWNITPKIKQVDELLCKYPEARLCISETHPEVCFTALNKGMPMEYSKTKTEEKVKGLEERRQVLRGSNPHTDEIIDYVLANPEKFPRKDVALVALNDVADALAAAITASKQGLGLKSLLEVPENDGKGLPMQILYYANKDN